MQENCTMVRFKRKRVKKTTIQKKRRRRRTTSIRTITVITNDTAIKKYRKKKKSSMDAVFSIINKVQIQRKPSDVTVAIEDKDTLQNILKDAEIEYNIVTTKTQVTFSLIPPPEKEEDTIFDIEYLDDEIIEEGQIF